MLYSLKRALARNAGKNYELCYDAFQEGRAQGKILIAKYEKTEEPKANPSNIPA